MPTRRSTRSDETWLQALRETSNAGSARLEELRGYVLRIVNKVSRGRLGVDVVEELAQETLTRVIENLDEFRGEAAFTTWVAGVATRVAFTELRRRSFRERRHDPFETIERTAREPSDPKVRSPLEALTEEALFAALEEAIASALTERQRVAILSELQGVPTVVIAERLGTNVNALYKLVHDARRKLRAVLLERGFSADMMRGGGVGGSR